MAVCGVWKPTMAELGLLDPKNLALLTRFDSTTWTESVVSCSADELNTFLEILLSCANSMVKEYCIKKVALPPASTKGLAGKSCWEYDYKQDNIMIIINDVRSCCHLLYDTIEDRPDTVDHGCKLLLTEGFKEKFAANYTEALTIWRIV